MSAEGWEYFEVAADIGLRAWGPSLEACGRQAALGMFQLMVDLGTVRPAETREAAAQGESPEALVVNWLNELIYLHDVEGFAIHDVTSIRHDDGRLHAVLTGEPVDPARHPRGVLVKAATFHQLAVEQVPGQVSVRVVLDI
jgi:SHS2 domain-containing protein